MPPDDSRLLFHDGISLANDECVLAQEKLCWIEGFCRPDEPEKRTDDAETDSIQIWSRDVGMPIVLLPSFSARVTKVSAGRESFSRPQEEKGGDRKAVGLCIVTRSTHHRC
jgi:hypothetical protein